MDYEFTELFDIPHLTELCESFTRINGTVTALLDLDGHVHIKTGWQRICTQFHRVNALTSQRCTESDTALAGQLAAGARYNIYKCKNGLMDVAVPVIIDGEHVGNFFTGQFLYKKPDRAQFARQAEEVGFDEIPYLDALDEVPVFDEDTVKRTMDFLVRLTESVGRMGKQRLDLLRSEAQQRKMLESLVEQRTRELQEAKAKLEKLAQQDGLTELDNRRSFEERMKLEFSRVRRYAEPLSVGLLDADYFKKINDTYGHPAGDQVLLGIANVIRNGVRDTDFAARIGGEEFSILMPGTTESEAKVLLERLRKKIEGLIFRSGTDTFHVTCSFGVATADQTCRTPSELMKHADEALYEAKGRGRNCVVLYPVQRH